MEPGWRPGDFDAYQVEEKLRDALGLYEHLTGGGKIQPVMTSLLLERDEFAYADELMECSRFEADDSFGQLTPVSYLSPTDVTKSIIRNRIWRESGAAQWRDAVAFRVAITNRRLLISVDNCWASFGYHTIAEFLPTLAKLTLELRFYDDVPLRLRAPDLPARAVLMASYLYELPELPEAPGFGVLFGQ